MSHELAGIEDSPVSFATVGAGVGLFLGPVGLLAGAAIGAIADVFVGAYAKKKARKKAKEAFLAKLLKRYDTQIFISALERIGTAMVYLSSLGLKPGTKEFDNLLVKKLSTGTGYRGNCAIDLYGPAPPGQPRRLVATIDRKGNLTPHSPHIDLKLGEKWAEACKELHKAALQAWAEEQKESILLQREVKAEKETAKRNTITRILVNGGIIMLMMGYTIRQKKKLKKLRRVKAKKAKEKTTLEKSSE